ncbi:MAG: ATP-dependent helicase [Lachnospiraceae bacterium]|nr:ATP-dependent helicase [Lachnospiraceae bacterium]
MILTCNNNYSFNEEQELARTHLRGPALILAGPGSGKTRVITGRLSYLIGESAVSPSSILTITFTKAAAEEMKSRAFSLIGNPASAVNFGTFHSIFLLILRNRYRFGPENIIKSRMQYEISKEIIESEKIEIRDSDRFYSDLISEISRYKTFRKPDEEFRSSVLDNESFHIFYEHYKKRLNSLRLIDFDDMILRCNELFHERDDIRKKWSEKYEYIMIDEFQDIDTVQYDTIKMLSGEKRNLFAVGDDDQSIYGFRGAEPSIMKRFLEDYPDTKYIKLSKNYRSAPDIVKTAAIIISDNKNRLEKNIVSAKDVMHPKSVDIRGFKDHEEEINCLRDELIKSGQNNKSKAIILRTNSLSSYFASELMMRDIKVICKDKPNDIYNHFIVKDIFAYLAIAGGSKSRSDFYRIMNKPYRYISRNSVPGKEFDFDYMKKFHREDIRTFSALIKLENDIKLISKMRPYTAINYLFKGVGYLSYLKNYAFDKKLEYEQLKEKALFIKEKSRNFRTYSEWLENVEDYRSGINENKADIKSTDNNDGIIIMTMHASKGLEFDEVFLPDVNEKIIPYKKAVLPSDIEEERRLFYVAATRAKEKLHIWHIKDNFGKEMTSSRFIEKLCTEKSEK